WAMGVIVRSLDDATAASARDSSAAAAQESLAAMIRAFVTIAADSPNVYRFCDTAVNRFAPEETGGVFNSIAGLLAERLDLEGEQAQRWSAGAIGFVRAATETWLSRPDRSEEFATTISHWLWHPCPHNEEKDNETVA